MLGVHPIAHEGLSRRPFALSNFIFVVRKRQIDAAGVNIQRLAKILHGHRGAFNVPTRAALADWTVLLLAPLPFSPWLEPYHAIPMLPAAILLVAVALDDAILSRHRRIAVAALLAIVAVRMVGLPFSIRGLSLLAQFLVATVALGLLRPSLPVIPAERSGGPRCDRQPIAT